MLKRENVDASSDASAAKKGRHSDTSSSLVEYTVKSGALVAVPKANVSRLRFISNSSCNFYIYYVFSISMNTYILYVFLEA
jgi:hypothetical protein